ncbi:MAG: COR domain-containing protein, partial [Bryobacteraceae bacterium]
TELSPLAGLSALQTLDVSNAPVNDLEALAGLCALQMLVVAGSRAADLTPLAGLSGLQMLDVSRTPVADLRPLAGLSALQRLNVSQTAVTDLRPLAGLSALQTLDVSHTPVTDLAPLADVSALQTLNLSGSTVADLATLAGLSALRTLYASRVQVTDLSPLAGLSALQTLSVSRTKVTSLAPLAGLSALQMLTASDMPVTDLAPLAGLAALRILDVSRTPVDQLPALAFRALQMLNVSGTQVADLSPLAGLCALWELDLSSTPVIDLRPLASLPALRTLNVSRTQVSDVGPLAGLPVLDTLDTSRTQVTDLSALVPLIARGCPVLWSSESFRGRGIYVGDCPLINPPPEIVKQGNDAILNCFREKALGELDHLYEAKMLILGEGGAGKTSLLRRLYQPGQPLPTEKESTKGISIHQHEFRLGNGRRFRLNVWDFGGQEIYHATHQFFLTRRSLYLLVDDTRKDYKSASDPGFRYWLELVDVFGGRSPVLIFQNEKAGRSKAIDIGGIKGRYDNVKDLYAGNLEQGDSAEKLRDGIEFYAAQLSHIGEQLPARWIKVREEIEARAREVPHIPQQEYFQIYGRHLEFDRSRALHLSRYLHDLGVFLHFQDDPLLARTVILQNQWATEAVFRILDDETVKAQLGRFNAADCERLWRDSVYADMHPELLALMQRFELCYELRERRPPEWLAPQLLPPAKPTELADWGQPADLVLRYRYDFLPTGIISRLTVRLHRFLDPNLAWVTGVLFQIESSAVLVELLANGSEIELRGRGPERKALLSVIAADLDALNDSIPGLRAKVDKLIPCNCKQCRTAPVPEFFSQKILLRRKEDGRLRVECPRSYEDVDVLELLDGIRVEQLPDWGKKEPVAATPRTYRIFLASSAELREDRDAFDLYFRQQNDQLREKGLYLEIVRWENFLDAMSETRLQDEYNKAVRNCDIFVCLFFTKTGKFTDEEFEVAHRQFRASGRPSIYTFFKDAEVKIGNAREEDFNSLWAFQKKLDQLGHFRTKYTSIEDLKLKFRDQLDKLGW